VVETHGVRVVLDFGHNPAAATALYAWARLLAGRFHRVLAVLTQPGDRDDAAMDAFVLAVARAGVSHATVWESESLLRGRAPRVIVGTLMGSLAAAGVRADHAASEADAIRLALGRARRGDVVVVSPSLDRRVPRRA
jgi:cyanophycin synthetase